MKKTDADSKLEYLETSDEARAAGLHRIKRRHYTGSLEDLPSERVKFEVVLDDEVAEYFHHNSNRINSVLRSAMKHEKIARASG